MKPNKQKQKLTLSKQSILKLTDVFSNKINGGNLPTNFTASLAETCKCSFPPKCGSETMI
jgi:hypothetical protein